MPALRNLFSPTGGLNRVVVQDPGPVQAECEEGLEPR